MEKFIKKVGTWVWEMGLECYIVFWNTDFEKDRDMSIKKIFSTSIIITLLLFVMILFFTITIGYENTISELIHYFKYEKHEEKIKLLISKNKFHYLQGGIFILILALCIILIYIKTILNFFVFYLKDLKFSLIKSVKGLTDKYNIAILLFPILAIVYYAVNLPISYDEAFTYLNFSSKNFIVSLTYYPAPNNHILHSLLTNITNFFLPAFPLFSLRITSVIISFLTLLVGLYSIKKHYNQNISITSIGIFSVLFMGIYYGYMSRGYSLKLFFFVASFHFALNLIKNPNNVRDWVWLTVFSILGFFTMPSYLYAFAVINIIIFFFNSKKSAFVNQIKYSFITIITVTILYLPTIIVSGLTSLTTNKFVAPKSREVVFSNLPEFLFQTLEDIVGVNAIILLSIIIISFLLLLRNKDWFHVKLFTLFLIIPPLLLLIHSVIPFSRTFNYYGFILVLLFLISIKFLLDKIKIKALVIIIIALQVLFIYNFNNKIYNYEKYSIKAKEINSTIISEGNSYLVNSGLFDAYLIYALKVEKITNYTVDYFPAINMSADTINTYNYIIIDKGIDKTTIKKPIYTSEYFSIYK